MLIIYQSKLMTNILTMKWCARLATLRKYFAIVDIVKALPKCVNRNILHE